MDAGAFATGTPESIRREVGLQLRLHRHRAGLSQTQVAEASGWSLSAISMYEQGQREAGYAKLRYLADLFGVSVGDFFAPPDDELTARLRALEERVAALEASQPRVRTGAANGSA